LSPTEVNDLYNDNLPGTDGLVVYYDFDNSSALAPNGTEDVSLYGNNATCSGVCPSWTTEGRYNGAFDFNNNQHFDISEPGSLPLGTTPLTMCAWAKTYDLSALGGTFLAYGGYPDNLAMSRWGCDLDAGSPGDFLSVTNFWCSAGTNVWKYICLTYDGTDATIYTDGKVAAGPTPTSWNTQPGVGYIGTSIDDIWGWIGAIDEVRIYNRSLSSDEVKELYESNLNKYGSNQWQFIINQSFAPFPAMAGYYNFSYYGCASDSEGNGNCTETRNITYQLNAPQI